MVSDVGLQLLSVVAALLVVGHGSMVNVTDPFRLLHRGDVQSSLHRGQVSEEHGYRQWLYVAHRSQNDISRRQNEDAGGWIRACYMSPGLSVETLDPHLCTHLLLFISHVTSDGLLAFDEDYRQVLDPTLQLRLKNPKLHVCLTVGGTNDHFALAASNDTSRSVFTASVVRILQDTDLDGVDIDWEFPAFFRPFVERRHFTQLLSALKVSLKAMRRPRLLTIAVGAPTTIINLSYEVPLIAGLVDFISIMTYDFHLFSKLIPATGHNAPLFASSEDRGFFNTLNVNTSVHYWLLKGMPPEKVLIGLPTYGHGWTLVSSDDHGLYAPSSGPWRGGYTTLADACRLKDAGASTVWDSFSLVPYIYIKHQWVSFDDVRSITAKAAYVRTMNVAGAMTYNLNSDDASDVCGSGRYPLHQTIKALLP